MAKANILAGLDIGSFSVRTTIIEDSSEGEDLLRVIGVGEVPSAGLRKGVVADMEELSKAISQSVEKAEKMAGVSVSEVMVSLGGQNIRTQNAKGVIAVGRADGEVTQEDIERVVAAAGEVDVPLNNEIIHVIPKSYRLDDQMDIKNPIGMKGVRLEVEAFIVEGFSPQIKNLLKCLHFSGVESEHFILSPLAAAEAVLDKRQLELGVVLVDIGSASTGISIFEEGDLLMTTILPFGAGHITNDIAIGIRSSIETAEKIKLLYGTASTEGIDKNEDIHLEEVDSGESGEVSRFHIAEIIEARLEELFEAVNAELTKIDREGLLPAGAVLVGGGAKLPGIVDLAKKKLQLPVTIGYPLELGGLLDKVDDPAYATSTGLVKWRHKMPDYSQRNVFGSTNVFKKLPGNWDSVSSKLGEWFRKFLP